MVRFGLELSYATLIVSALFSLAVWLFVGFALFCTLFIGDLLRYDCFSFVAGFVNGVIISRGHAKARESLVPALL
jgi:hypothetical protein